MESDLLYASSSAAELDRASLGFSDPIAGVIGLLRPVTVVDPGLRATRSWAVRFDAFPHVKIGGLVQGECWLALDGHEPVKLREGDFFMLVDPPSYVLADDLATEARPACELWASAMDGVVRIGPEADEIAYVCGGHFRFDESNASLLVDILPTLVHVAADDPRIHGLSQVTSLLNAEVQSNAAGRSLVLDHLVQILFVQVLRAHAERTDRPTGWLGALADDGIGAALRAMHTDVARRWTLQELAGISHMSRSSFAAAFREQIGTTPLDYLIQWRMSLARDALRRNTRSISELAFAVGYESESAFGTAFRRVNGASPRQFRDAARQPSSSQKL
ncbi:AraC family transcriptional regulator [Actinoplanes sp. LDG1-06]|uniref:AraC family transcriptional regulator n=1 Tax=Paractinoplanes ovalisporus TaxID=2810368 RepID=A0ABS2AHX0_9ACTN|nr:AraC family transcriptional regulator [Actinoplanes ovalisporus]MBM2619436.1 AraC family transcriptional regulator [Actinoplanes ovalisporus]